MTLRPPSEKLESNAIKKFKTGKLLPNWPHLAANPLACSGRKWSGLIWPQLPWLVLAATQMALCGREFTNSKSDLGFPVFDCAEVHAAAIAQCAMRSFSEPPSI